MNRFLLRISVLLILLTITSFTQATNFYTLTTGNYTNNVSLWSLDGTTPCTCNPGTSLVAGDSVFIRHDLDMTTVTLQNGAVMTISPGVMVIGTGSLSNLNGTVINNGSLTIASISNSGGQFISNGILDVTAGNFYNIGGTVDLTGYTNVAQSYRNLDLGTLILRTNSTLVVGAFFFNIGTTVTESGACINVAANYLNPEIGTVIGSGHIAADFNITNNGLWDANTTWCAGVTGTGLPGPPNCINCGPLPVTLASFEAVYRREDRSVDIQWTTSSEINNAYFIVEHSRDGEVFESLEIVESKLVSGISGSYELTDDDPADGVNYYRLRQVDKDGSEVILETTSLFVNDAIHNSAHFYPNPSNGPLNYAVALEKEEELTVSVMDLRGSVVFELILPASIHHEGTIDLSWFPVGTYLVKVHSPNFQSTRKVTRF